MKIGIPKEVKTLEGRVALIPEAAAELCRQGHEVFIQSGAGVQSGYPDAAYVSLGINVLPDASSLFAQAEMIVKVKEPQAAELALLTARHTLFSYLHLAAEVPLMRRLQAIGLTAVAFETVTDPQGRLPLLAPMSDIAGRLSVQIGSQLLQQPQGGRGVLLGGLPGTERGKVVILGGGIAGSNAALMAASMGADVTVFEPNRDRQQALRGLGDNVTARHPFASAIHEAVIEADLLIGAVLVTGDRAPHLVLADTVRQMKSGSVIIDISVDQGGCIETTHPTTYAEPTYVWEGVVHFGVTNMPGAVPRTSSQALSAALVPYILRLTKTGWEQEAGLAAGINVRAGEIIHPALKKYA